MSGVELRADGKTAVITGAARGIGLGIAERLLADGYRVALRISMARRSRRRRPRSVSPTSS